MGRGEPRVMGKTVGGPVGPPTFSVSLYLCNPDMVIQDSTVSTFADFTGPVTVVNQYVGMEANNLEIASDADLDKVALTQDPKDPLTAAYNTSGDFESQADYLAHVSDMVTHELGENYGNTGVQHHYDDVHGRK